MPDESLPVDKAGTWRPSRIKSSRRERRAISRGRFSSIRYTSCSVARLGRRSCRNDRNTLISFDIASRPAETSITPERNSSRDALSGARNSASLQLRIARNCLLMAVFLISNTVQPPAGATPIRSRPICESGRSRMILRVEGDLRWVGRARLPPGVSSQNGSAVVEPVEPRENDGPWR